jgi:pimeloyl-ACP methyl ester carboxylesterase
MRCRSKVGSVTRVMADDGVEVAVHHLHGEGPLPLVLAHATGFCGPALAPLARRLGRGLSCLALDERGHGLSGVPAGGDFEWHGFAADVLAVVGGMGLEGPLGFGHSCGATALLLAEQARPGTFRALYCFEPILFSPEERAEAAVRAGEHPMVMAARRRREVFASREEARDNFRAKPPLQALDPEALDGYLEGGFEDLGGGRVRLRCRAEHEARVYAAGLAHDAWDHLERVRCPVVVAHGSRSAVMDAKRAQAVASRLTRGRAEQVPGVGHFGPLEDPGVVAASLLETLVLPRCWRPWS